MKQLQKYIPVLLVFLFALLAGRWLLMPGFFSMHDDLQVMRQYQMHRCFMDGQIPCRWVPDLGAGYGFPLFNFYSPLPSYVGMVFVWLGFSYVSTTKLLLLMGFIFSALAMYWFVNLVTKSRWAGITAAVLYTWAPYHAVDVYVRGALAESWALAWFPLILGLIWKWAGSDRKRVEPLIGACVAGLLLSHNIMSLWFIPITAIWSLCCLVWFKIRNWKDWLRLMVSGLWGLGLAAFLVLPAIAEKGLVHSDTLTSDYFDFRSHFVTIDQLFFDRSWDFGASVWGPIDDMSFQLGWPHWWVGALAALGLILNWRKFDRRIQGVVLFFGILTGAITLLTHGRTVLIWETVPILAWTQFPWRILALSILGLSILGGLVIIMIPVKYRMGLSMAIIVLTLALNWGYFRLDAYNPNLTDEDKLSGEQWDNQRRAALLDYLPKTVQTYDVLLAEEPVMIVDDQEQVRWENFLYRSDYFSLDVFNEGNESAYVQVGVFDFPIWQVYVDGEEVPVTHDNEFGLITFPVSPGGKHIVTGWFENTPVRVLGNGITMVSFLALLGYMVVIGRTKEVY